MSDRAATLALLVTTLFSGAALADSTFTMTHTGRLLDASDAPVTQTALSMKFRIFVASAPSSTETGAVWTGSCPVDVVAGLYAVSLGDGTCGSGLPTALFNPAEARFLEIAIGEVTLSPRLRIGAAPMAAVAARGLDADKLGGVLPAGYWQKSEHVDAATLGGAALTDLWQKKERVDAATVGSLGPADLWKKSDDLGGAALGGGTLGAAVGDRWAKGDDLGAAKYGAGTLGSALTDRASTSASYADPAFITALSAAKLTGTLSAVDGSKVTNLNAGAVASGTLSYDRLPVGTAAKTLAAGDDARLSDARAALPGSADYIQNNASATRQTGSFNLKGTGSVDDLFVGGVNVLDLFPFYRMTANQELNSASATNIDGWGVNTGQGMSVQYQFTVNTNVAFSARTAEEQALLTAMGRAGVQYIKSPFRVYRLSWTQAGVWTMFQHIPQLPTYTTAAFTKLESGAISGQWADGTKATWSLTGVHETPAANGYQHIHPITGSVTGSLLVAMPASVAGFVDLRRPINWGWFPYVPVATVDQ